MKPLAIGLAIVGAAATATSIFLATRKQEPPTPEPPEPPKTYGETVKVALPVPSGWRRVTGAEVSALPELVSRAVALRNTPGFTSMTYGTLAPFAASDGGTYATWVEQHYHPPGGVALPWGLHHGVTLLTQIG